MTMNIATYTTSALPPAHRQSKNAYLYHQELLPNSVSDCSTRSLRVPYSEYI